MSRLLFIIIGALLLGIVGFFIGSGISQYQVRVLFYGPDQAGEFIDVFLIIWPLLFIAGGFLGNWLYHRNLTRRSSGRS